VFFAVAFWKIFATIRYEKNIKVYMIIAGSGIFLIFSSNQGEAQITGPYTPFGLATITVLNIAAFLMLVGIYNSVVLVSTNNDLRQSIYKYALGSKLLGQIGRAEVELNTVCSALGSKMSYLECCNEHDIDRMASFYTSTIRMN
jgi:hypothetical protein